MFAEIGSRSVVAHLLRRVPETNWRRRSFHRQDLSAPFPSFEDSPPLVNCPTDDLCIFIWISVFPNPIYNREGSLFPPPLSKILPPWNITEGGSPLCAKIPSSPATKESPTILTRCVVTCAGSLIYQQWFLLLWGGERGKLSCFFNS